MSYASSAIKRLSNEYRQLQKPENRVCDYHVAPLEENIFEWHFTLRGPAGHDNSLPYREGLYHGAVIFSRSYPLEPPDIIFFTKNGRFSTNVKICSTISSFHPELWQPTYDVALTMTALKHFMAQEDEIGLGALLQKEVSLDDKVTWAKESWSFSCRTCGRTTRGDWETEMQMYPETALEKIALVPALSPPATATAVEAPSAMEAADSSPHRTEDEKAEREVNTQESSPAASVEQEAAQDQSSAASQSDREGVDTTSSPTREVVSTPPAASAPPPNKTAAERQPSRSTSAHGYLVDSMMDDAALDKFEALNFKFYSRFKKDVLDPVARDQSPPTTPLPSDAGDGREPAMADTGSGASHMSFEALLRAAIQREMQAQAVAEGAAPSSSHPTPPHQLLSPTTASPIVEELPTEELGQEMNGLATPAPPVQPPPPPPRIAENVVFHVYTYTIPIPLWFVDRAISGSFGFVVLILLRRMVWALLLILWGNL
ncbi:putative ubiquitin-conjugating enzyme [Leptomonas seymouri]|uniref:Putative ubiquitin-conjugating enzyme n=1 Tax=Leptomonas seymouri TaxID=5684 RepID=A0A0N1I1C5_LEPSE|nr:putative ubiquitin-conjugating enzyme [Leptomonas seymouri]|eukprot:KPI84031.1 putative ubiquitin-conjugating enzyme [Leptomonas seymouri]